jgi:hypothetical protein
VLEYFVSAGRRVVQVDAGDDPPETVFQKVRQAIESNDCP